MDEELSTWSSWNKNSYNILDLKIAAERNSFNQIIEDDYEEEEEMEVDEQSEEELKEMSSVLDAACQRIEKYNREGSYLMSGGSSACVSARNSSHTMPSSMPESVDGGFAEIEELKALPPSLETALKVNQTLQKRYSSTLDRLQKALKENEIRMNTLNSKEKLLDQKSYDTSSKKPVKPSHFAFPYFKDRFGSHAPMNEDTAKKIEQNYLDLYTTKSRTWLTSERMRLSDAVIAEYKETVKNNWKIKLRDIERKLSQLEKEEDDDEKDEKYEALMQEKSTADSYICFFSEIEESKLDIPLDFEFDWDKIAATVFDGCRLPDECKLQWINYMHTRINKEPWTEKEDIFIQRMVNSYTEKPQWTEIAALLQSGRTPFQIFQRYVSFIKPSLEPAKWTEEASQNLIDTVSLLRVGNHIPWTQVSHHLLNYTPTQIQSKWRCLNPDYKNKRFNLDEDFTFVKGLYLFGLNWNMINNYLPGRTKTQIRDRFKKAILPGLVYRPWKAKEDKKILENISENNANWRKLAALLRNKRDGCQIRLRYASIQFWQNCSGKKVMPPPLFPLDQTTNVHRINFLRDRLKKLDMSRYQVMDEALIKGQTDKFVDSMAEDGDNEEESDDENDHVKLQSYRNKPKKQKLPSWPDRALTEFFMPCRPQEWHGAHDAYDHKLTEVALGLGKLLQVKIEDSNAIKRILSNEVHLTEYEGLERGDITYLERLHKQSMNPTYGITAHRIPILPPSSTTVGAFRSLLVHKEKLIEMAEKRFLFYNVPREQLAKLGPKERQLVFKEPEDYEKYNSDTEVDNNRKTKKVEIKKRRSAASKALYYNKAIANEAHYEELTLAPIFTPSPDETIEMQMGQELESLSSENTQHLTKAAEKKMIEKEDHLLFSRMLSMFFWPSIFTEVSPEEKLQIACNKKMVKMKEMCDLHNELSDEDEVMINRRAPRKKKDEQQLKDLNIPQLKQMIDALENNIPIHTTVSNAFPHAEEDEEMKDFIVKSKQELQEDKQRLKKHIISLKRRLVTKTVWEQRKTGSRPKRRPRGLGKIHDPVPKIEERRRSMRTSANKIDFHKFL